MGTILGENKTPASSGQGEKRNAGFTVGRAVFGVRFLLAFLLAKLLVRCLKLFGYSATSLPGVAALKICPGLVRFIAPSYELVVAVTGTNGKTTTSNLLAHILRSAGYTVAHNAEGANMLNGVAAALLRDSTWWGEAKSRVALIEVDEGSVGKVFAAIQPNLLVVTNYFRDQLDRYFELDRTAAHLMAAVKDIPGLQLVMNGDDPLVAATGHNLDRVVYYGVISESGTSKGEGGHETRERGYCNLCGGILQYRYYHYGQLGDYCCSNCSFQRPRLDYSVSTIEQLSPARFAIDSDRLSSGQIRCSVPLQGLFNVYNVLAASSTAAVLGIDTGTIETALLDYRTALGRMESFVMEGRPCTLALIKNPAGLNEVIKTLLERPGEKSLLIAINDLAADGKDVSWLWDADFERLNREDVVSITCSGRRAADMAVRLKYAGLPLESIQVIPEASRSLKELARQPGQEVFVLVTYTNLYSYARLLQKTVKSPDKQPRELERVGKAS